jgi:hypothetical protein
MQGEQQKALQSSSDGFMFTPMHNNHMLMSPASMSKDLSPP